MIPTDPNIHGQVQEFLRQYGVGSLSAIGQWNVTPADVVGGVSDAFGATLPVLSVLYRFGQNFLKSRKTSATLVDLLEQALPQLNLSVEDANAARAFLNTPSRQRDDFMHAETREAFKTALENILGPTNFESPHAQKLLEALVDIRFGQGEQTALEILREAIKDVPHETMRELNGLMAQQLTQHLEHVRQELNAQRRTATLRQPVEAWDADRAPSSILKANARSTNLIGRTALMNDLVNWCAADKNALVRLIHAPGGMGKTRLAVELCVHLNENGWQTGFLNPTASTPEQIASVLEHKADILIVLDYPEGHQDALKALIEEVAAKREARGFVTRVLLLARTDTWLETPRRNLQLGRDFLDPTSALMDVQELTTLESTTRENELQVRQALYNDAKHEYSIKLANTSWKRSSTTQAAAPDLTLAVFARPLMIQIQALLDCTDTQINGEDSIEYLLSCLMEHERKYWESLLGLQGSINEKQVILDSIQRTLARIVLGMTPRNATETVTVLRLESDFRDERTVTLRGYAVGLAKAYPGTPHLEPLQPDLLGEYLVLSALEDRNGNAIGDGLLEHCFTEMPVDGLPLNPARGITILARLTQWGRSSNGQHLKRLRISRPHLIRPALEVAGSGYRSIQREFLNELRSESRPVHLAKDLFEALPRFNTELVELGCISGELALADARTQNLPKFEIAAFGNDLGIRLGDTGRNEEALSVTHQAVEICRELAEENPKEFELYLAKTLNNFGGRLNDFGRYQEALDATLEAVTIQRKWPTDHPSGLNLDLAMSLSNLSTRYSKLGLFDAAFDAVHEALSIYLEAAKLSNESVPDVAACFDNQGLILGHLGKPEDALSVFIEAVKIRRQLYEANQFEFGPDLGGSLVNFAMALSNTNQGAKGLSFIQEALDIYRPLAAENPMNFKRLVGKALGVKGMLLSQLQRNDEAVSVKHELVQVFEFLYETNPGGFSSDLTAALNDLGNAQNAVRKHEDARLSFEKSIQINQTLAQKYPIAFSRRLASGLTGLCLAWIGLGKLDNAIEASLKSISVFEKLLLEHSMPVSYDLAQALSALGLIYDMTNELPSAKATVERALRVMLPLFQQDPKTAMPLTPQLLQQYLDRCTRLGTTPDLELLHNFGVSRK
jgi:tetratricopeptide (TPR) repeat protein